MKKRDQYESEQTEILKSVLICVCVGTDMANPLNTYNFW